MLHRRWFPEHLVGETVVLRRHTRENLRDFLRWYQDPEVARLTRYQDGPMRPDEIERFFMLRAMGPDSLAMGIHVRETDRLIGSCAFSQLDGDNGSVLFHITIGEHDAWGRGYGSEATALMVDHAFGSLGLHRVALTVFAFNERAIRSYQKVGFVVEGSAREAIWRDGRWWDEIHMSVLEPEWRSARWQARAIADGRLGVAGAGADAADVPAPASFIAPDQAARDWRA
jgi:RimJ/RimL family protein N-acetyltransferase